MNHSDFKVGDTFYSGSGKWLCTDKGSRVIVAIHMEDGRDPSWLKGPPYAVAEHVFDEYDMDGCSKEPIDP